MLRVIIMISVVLLSAAFLTRCAYRKAPKLPQNGTMPLMTLESFSCRGSCPVFQFSIDQNGMAHYLGKRYVDKIGQFSYPLSDQELASFKSIFDENNWTSIHEDTLSTYRDIQRIDLEYQGKRITLHRRAAGEDLLMILETLEQRIASLDWKAD